MRTFWVSRVAPAFLLAAVSVASAQDKAAVQKKLEGEYRLTKTTDDKSDIVTAGAVVVLHKDKVTMVAATSTGNPCMNTYKDGKISSGGCGALGILKKKPIWFPGVPGADKAPDSRNFVSDEKFWVTKINVQDNKVIFDFFTDAMKPNDTRYKGALTIPFPAGLPSPDETLKMVQQVITVEPEEDAKADAPAKGAAETPAPQGGQQQASNAPPPPAPANPATPAPVAIDAPPPPPPDPVSLAEGQTVAQVKAAMGEPLSDSKIGTKEILVYKNLKVTFVNGKVKDIQ